MIQRVFRQIQITHPDARIVVATGKMQVESILNQLQNSVEIVVEPERRDTFPAIALAVTYLHDKGGLDEDEPIVVMPVDTYAETQYFNVISGMEQAIRQNVADIALMGITPTYASEKYGYVIPSGHVGEYLSADSFEEKPSVSRAIELIREGALWNGGVFAFRVGFLLKKLEERGLPASYDLLLSNYSDLRRLSFDYEVVEKTNSIAVVPYSGLWKDLGTWNTLSEEIDKEIGNVICGEGTENTQIINELDIPLITLGAKDMVIVASPDGILVTGKNESSYMKPYVEQMEQRPMFEERRWGNYRVLESTVSESDLQKSLTKHLFIKAGKKLSYQSHESRDEIWTIVDGVGVVLLDGHTRNVKRGDVAFISAGMKHAVEAISNLHLIEVQIGERLEETDIVRYAMDW